MRETAGCGKRPTCYDRETIDVIENHVDHDQSLGITIYDSFSDKLHRGSLIHKAAADLDPFATNTNLIGELNSLGDIDMGEPCPTSWLANDESRAISLSWDLDESESPWQRSLYDPLNDTGVLKSWSDPNSVLIPTFRMLDGNESVALLPANNQPFNALTPPQQTQLLGVQRFHETTDLAETVAMSCGFDELELEVSANSSSSRMTSAQASLFQALLSLGESPVNAGFPQPPSALQLGLGSAGSQSSSTDRVVDQISGAYSEEDDPERIQTIICGQPVLDRNLESNSFPFVLHSYAVWAQRTLFDPLRVAPRMKDYIIRHFAESAQSRSRTILIANVIRSIATKPIFDLSYLPHLSALRATIHTTLKDASKHKKNPSREIQNRESIRALEQTLELCAASRHEPLHSCLQLMREAAPVFRRACPEPMNQLVHLPAILLHPNANLRYYPVMDVYFSIITGLPTNLKYDTSLRSSIDTSVLYIDNHLGLSWLYGQPDRITLILARINSLYQEFGACVDVSIILNIEQDIRCFKAVSGSSPDPSLLVTRLVVQECWRQVTYIYLYMTLCNTNALDARVRTAQQRLMKLINDTKPALALDMHLAPCLGIAGVVTYQPGEREAMLLRLRGLPECSRPDSCFSSCIRILEELWRQADNEGRPANWSDFRLATLRVLGIR